jgi:branched-chain amino acid transport system permease protein
MLAQLLASGIAVGAVYTLVALGMTLLYRSTTIVNFCHGEFFMLGAFGVMVPLQVLGWSYPASIATSLVLLLVVGSLTERALIRPLKNAPFVTLAMMTVALSYLLKGTSRFFYGREVVSLPPLLQGDPIDLGGFAMLFPQDMLVVGSMVVIVGMLSFFFARTRLGKVIQAASQTPRGASLVGIDVPLLRNAMWAAGAALGALAGILIAPSTLVYPDMGGHMLIRAFAAMCLGGFGSLPGAVAGGISLGILENLIGGYISSALVEITAYIVIVVVLVIRPQGLFGEWRQGRV